MINHITKEKDLYMYIDSIISNNDSFTFLGWLCSTREEIADIYIDGVQVNTEFTERPDVNSMYDTNNMLTGIKFTIDSESIFKQLHVKYIGSNDLHEFGTMARWVSYYSGFANDDKGLIVVDNFYANPDLIRKWAIDEIEFSSSDYHKGERATTRFSINGTKEKLEQIIGKPIYNWNHDSYANGIFQFCTADQPIVYHVDNQTYAGIVFLTPDAPVNTGTTFYRSKVTGDYRFDDEKRKTESYVRAFQGKSAEMNFYDATNFEKIDEVGNVYNRLVLFDAKNIHAATQYFGDAIDNSRFFHMFFFDV